MVNLVVLLALGTVWLFPVAVRSEIQPGSMQLSGEEVLLTAWIEDNHTIMLRDLETYVNINTGTFNHNGLNHLRNLLEGELKSLGFETATLPGGEIDLLSCKNGNIVFADHLIARRTGKSSLKILLAGHLDTVFSKDDPFQTLSQHPDGTLRGPGVLDMKGGILILKYALKALHHHRRLQDAHITIFLNTDEETGSLGSRIFLKELAGKHDIGLMMEGSHDHKLARRRKGLGQARIKVRGREAHAGEAHADGVSANLELAQKIIALEALTNYQRMMTVNVGIMQGGEKRNTRPGCADAFVDLRFATPQDGRELEAEVKRIALTQYSQHPDFPDLPQSEFWSVLHRPVKTIHPVTDALIAEAIGLSAQLGERIVGTYLSGGGTDGSLTQAQGLPTVDDLGLNGGGAHSSREWTTTTSLLARAKLLTVLLDRLIHHKHHNWKRDRPLHESPAREE